MRKFISSSQTLELQNLFHIHFEVVWLNLPTSIKFWKEKIIQWITDRLLT